MKSSIFSLNNRKKLGANITNTKKHVHKKISFYFLTSFSNKNWCNNCPALQADYIVFSTVELGYNELSGTIIICT